VPSHFNWTLHPFQPLRDIIKSQFHRTVGAAIYRRLYIYNRGSCSTYQCPGSYWVFHKTWFFGPISATWRTYGQLYDWIYRQNTINTVHKRHYEHRLTVKCNTDDADSAINTATRINHLLVLCALKDTAGLKAVPTTKGWKFSSSGLLDGCLWYSKAPRSHTYGYWCKNKKNKIQRWC